MLITGIILIIAGTLLRHYAFRRRFNRRNEYGVEMHSSYTSAVLKNKVENLLVLIGNITLFVGVCIAASSFFV
jgi:hypothetical protein